MRKLMLLAGAAALGLTMPALAKEQGRGGGGRGDGQAAHAERHGGGQGARAERGGGHGKQARDARGGGHETHVARGRGNARERLNGQERRAERAIQQERRAVRQARGDQRRVERLNRGDERRLARQVHVDDRRDWRGWSERRVVHADGDDFVPGRGDRGRRLAIGPAGCPPGLARQNAYCMPPGQLRKAQLIGQRLPFANLGYNIPDRYRYRFADDDRFFFRYGNDGTVYRFDRGSGLVSAVIPLTSSGLLFGEPLPLGYDVYNVPFAYRRFYPDTSDYLYRYDGNSIYRVDADTMLVNGIVALLTGGNGGLGALGVGDRVPLGYDVYNVPLDYRDTYYDTDDWMYRYADGSIYQIDPETMLIASVVSLLV